VADDEPVDVVDLDDHVVDTVSRAQMRTQRLRHRCTFVVVRSSAGDVLIHRRSDDKDMWPGRWDLAAGGVVSAGEEWEVAARRELAEELGVTVAELVPLGGGAYEDADVAELAKVWTAVHDGPFTFTDDEVVEAHFVSLDELAERMARDLFVPDSRALVYPLVTGLAGEAD
jgi:isopentenyldiphosphate isomerase